MHILNANVNKHKLIDLSLYCKITLNIFVAFSNTSSRLVPDLN